MRFNCALPANWLKAVVTNASTIASRAMFVEIGGSLSLVARDPSNVMQIIAILRNVASIYEVYKEESVKEGLEIQIDTLKQILPPSSDIKKDDEISISTEGKVLDIKFKDEIGSLRVEPIKEPYIIDVDEHLEYKAHLMLSLKPFRDIIRKMVKLSDRYFPHVRLMYQGRALGEPKLYTKLCDGVSFSKTFKASREEIIVVNEDPDIRDIRVTFGAKHLLSLLRLPAKVVDIYLSKQGVLKLVFPEYFVTSWLAPVID